LAKKTEGSAVPVKCPKCQSENPETSRFCADCGTQLGGDGFRGHVPDSPESGTRPQKSRDVSPEVTKTLQTPINELATGSTLAGRYQIIEELGHGGMGRVYKVFDTDIQEKVALKLLRPEIASEKETVERFSNELKLARKISHRNVCRMFDLGKAEGTTFITMEFVPGEDLKRLIRKMGQVGVGRAVSIGKQVCEGLAEAHHLGVVHRDLKPQNIMVDEEGNVRIMDFGIARSLKVKGITGAGVMIGTPEYMSPEQVEGKEADPRSDIYSLGIILYEMLTGRVPFEGDTPFTIGVKHKSEAPQDPRQLNAQIPEDLSRLILKCLEKDREKRCQTTDELRSELEKIERGIPTTERHIPKRKTVTSKPITVTLSRKNLLIPASVIALAAMAAVIWFVFLKKAAPLLPEQKRSIAVISFENQTGDKAYDYLSKVIPNLLITNLEQSGYFSVTSWERLRDLLKQIGRGDVEFISSDLGFELCQKDGVEVIVLGLVSKSGNTFVTDAKVLEVRTKKLLGTANSRGDSPDSIFKGQVDELSRQIAKNVGLSEHRIEAAKMRVRDVTTGSPEAYNYYLRGKEQLTSFDWDGARQSLKKAVELDPTFASAYRGLAQAYHMLNDYQNREEAIKNAWNFSKRATEEERVVIAGLYALLIEKDPEKAHRIVAEAVDRYPKNKEVHFYLGQSFWLKEMYEPAVEEYNKALNLDPNFPNALNMAGYSYMSLREYGKAVEYFKRYAAVLPGSPNPVDSLAECYFRMGKLDEAAENYKKALAIKPDYYLSMDILGYIYALKEDYSEASKWLDTYISAAPSSGVKLLGFMGKAFYSSWLGGLERSLIYLDRAEDLADATGNKRQKALVSRLRSWIYYDR
jgi:eukaryotic-like serine/threonine-protein kinase